MKTEKLRDESGQVLVLTALCMACLLGMMAFAVDIGTFLHVKRSIQSAADSAAMAGAAEINYYTIDKTTVQASAQAAATQNGFTNGSNGATVTVNYAPLSGPYTGNTAYVEVIIQQTEPTFFMRMFNINSQGVAARAVAGLGAINSGCIFVMSPNASPAMHLQGNFTVNAPSCGVVIDSNDPNALQFTGAKGSLTAGSITVAGGDSGQTGDSNPAPTLGAAAVSDPLSFITPPDPSKLSCTPGGTLTGIVGASLNGGTVCYSGNVTIHNATLDNGTYVFTGNVTLDGTVQTGTGGATLDINSGSMAENTGTTLTLVAPTTGTYSGYVIMEPKTNTSPLAFSIGDATGSVTGIIYAPSAALTMQDAGGNKKGALNFTTDLVVGTFSDTSALFNMTSYSQANPNTSPLKVPTLVE